MGRITRLPLLVILTGVTALAMYLPAAHAAVMRDYQVARPFFYGGTVFLLLTVMVGIASSSNRIRPAARSQILTILGAYLWLPVVMAVPFNQAVPDTAFFNAWWEMLSGFTTTGATLYDSPGRLPASVHLWRGLTGWLGGFFALLCISAILAPLGLGGMEVLSGRLSGGREGGGPNMRGADSSARIAYYAGVIFPAYTALTLVLWVILLTLGESGLAALILAMSTLSTSGISFATGLHETRSGMPGELAIFVFLLLSLTRRSLPGPVLIPRSTPLWRDPELRIAAVIMVLVPLVLFLRHWIGSFETDDVTDWLAAIRALWGAIFTTLSYLTTTGFESADWGAARSWSGLRAPGLLLLGLAMLGGGIATAAGGLKLLRVYALARHGERELDRLIHPSSIGGGGEMERQLRRGGAYMSWIFFMLYALSFAVMLAAFAVGDLDFDPALVLTVAMVTTTGPMTALGADGPIRIAELSPYIKAVAAVGMIVGRMEVLAILALLAPGAWRR
ncbi:MAG: potassium transporter TrkG [Pseudorhodobacter sp.]